MSDHLHGSEAYYLENISDNIARLADNFTSMTLEHHSQLMTKVMQTSDSTERVLAAFRDLLNLENECAVYVRELKALRDKAVRYEMRNDFKFAFETVLAMRKVPDEVKAYAETLYGEALYDIVTAFLHVREIIFSVISEREKAKERTKQLVNEDSKL